MKLPPYSGPFRVGAIDLEIPVRQPRSFCDNVVKPGDLNRPSKKAQRRAAKAGESRRDEKQSEDNVCDDSSWSPFTSGAETCTLHLETVLFTIYYPTATLSEDDAKQYPNVAWLGRPKHTGIAALFKYIGQYGPFAVPVSPAILTLVSERMPALVAPPLADPSKLGSRADINSPHLDRATAGNFGQLPPRFPVLIFSHGLAGNRLSYSQYCGELASQGIVVVAIEHRDGSGVSSIVRGEEAPQHSESQGKRPSKSKSTKLQVPYLVFETIGLHSFSDTPDEKDVNLRHDQINMRHAEIQECLYVLQQINEGHGADIVKSSRRKLGTKLAGKRASPTSKNIPASSIIKSDAPLADWKDKLDLAYPTLCGHSFGGATVIEMMRSETNVFPFAIVLDPWVDPVRDPEQEQDQVKGLLRKPIYVLNSESFTVWEKHFGKLKRICLDARNSNEESRGWLMTLCGSKHTDFSDYPFLLPRMFRSTVGPRKTIEVFVKATFMQMGLMRQRFREKADRPGYKINQDGDLKVAGIEKSQEDTGEVALSDSPPSQSEARASKEGGKCDSGSKLQEAKEVAREKLEAGKRGSQERDEFDETAFREKRREEKEKEERERDFVTDWRQVSMIDADRDTEEVHASLEEISKSLAYKQTRPRSLMSLFMYLNGFQPGLEKPGQVLIHRF